MLVLLDLTLAIVATVTQTSFTHASRYCHAGFMDKKNLEALAQWGAKKMLTDIANIPPQQTEDDYKQALEQCREFVRRYGRLRNKGQQYNTLDDHAAEVRMFAPTCWHAWRANTQDEMDAVSRELDGIFEPNMYDMGKGTAVKSDFSTGSWTPVARDLLDVLALELVKSRKLLHRCERPDCGRYFIKSFSRDRYCSTACGEIMRERGQRQWLEDHRKEVNEKRRKPTRGKKGK